MDLIGYVDDLRKMQREGDVPDEKPVEDDEVDIEETDDDLESSDNPDDEDEDDGA